MKNNMLNSLKQCLPILLTVMALNLAHAQSEINIVQTGVFGQKPIPVALQGFSGDVLETLKFDLYVQGFSFVAPDAAQYVISGSNSGDVQGRLMDRLAQRTLFAHSYNGASLRRQAHALANDIVLAVTGKPGIALTKIACKIESTPGHDEIYIADFDGHNPQPVTHDNTIASAPSWVPGRLALCYNSYLRNNPDIFFQDLTNGRRRDIAHYSGSNISPSVSPDGSKVAFIASMSGSPNVWVCNLDGSGLKQLTHTVEDDSSPCWSPDGKWICFATRIHERRMLAKIPASGGAIEIISTAGVANPTEPDWSPDGKWIAFTSQMGNFSVCVVPAAGGPPIVLVTGEDPSWSPNSRTLIYTRRVHYRYELSVLDVFTKQAKDTARISGNDSQPAWAK